MSKPVVFKRGERVALRAAFLRSIGDYSARSADKRGTVVRNEYGGHLIRLTWDGAPHSCLVNRANLIHADRLHLEPA